MNKDFDDSEEEVNDLSESELVSRHLFTIDMVARYADPNDDLILHWGMSQQKVGQWVAPPDTIMPQLSVRWPDGKACQTTFKKEEQNPSIRTTTIVVQWMQDVDQPFTSISWVLTEKNKQCWHNVGGIDQHIIMCPSAEE